MSKIEKFEDLSVGKEAVVIGVDVYKLTNKSKLKRDFPAIDQLRRAALSISNNIAEGFEYNNPNYAKGSAGELRSNLYVLKEANVVDSEDYETISNKLIAISKSIKGFMKYLKDFNNKNN